MVPIYTQVESSPAYYDTTTTVDTHDFYWANRLIASMADAHFTDCQEAIESYQEATLSMGHAVLKATDKKVMKLETNLSLGPVLEAANQDLADQVQAATNDLLYDIVFTTGNLMKNAFHRGD
jgi:dipeptidase